MALRDKLTDGPLRPPPKTCAVCWVQSWMPDDDREVLDVMLNDRARYSGPGIADDLRAEYDAVVGADAVARHRRLHMDAP